MGIKNSGASTPSAINRQLGTAYDDVRTVSQNIEDITAVADSLGSGGFQDVIDNLPEILQADEEAAAAKVSAAEAKASEELAADYTDGLNLGGGTFTPEVGSEYPDVTSVVHDTSYAVSFTGSSDFYEFTTGDLIGKFVEIR